MIVVTQRTTIGEIKMTQEIGIRELKTRASEVVRAVKETQARYIITQHGKPAALIIPINAEIK